jgi:hypothetical protein
MSNASMVHPHSHNPELEAGRASELARGRFKLVRTHSGRFFADVHVWTLLGEIHAQIELAPHAAHALADAQAQHVAEQQHAHTVGFSFGAFGELARQFEGIAQHVTTIATENVGPMFGIPPGIAGGLVELLMQAHAGHPDAKKRVASMARNPRFAGALAQLSQHMRAHPDFGALKAQGAALLARGAHTTGCASRQATGGPVVRRTIVGYSHPVYGDEMTVGAAPLYGDEMTTGAAAPVYGDEMTVGFSFGDITSAIGDVASSAVHAVEKVAAPVVKGAIHTIEHIAAPVVKAVKGVANKAAHAIEHAWNTVGHGLSDAVKTAAHIVAKAHLGDLGAVKFIRDAVSAAAKGIGGAAANVANALAKGAEFVAKHVDLPKILADAIPIPAVRRIAQSVISMVDPNAHFAEAVEALRTGNFAKLKEMAQRDLSEAQGVISLVPGVGSGVSAALSAAQALLDGGSPLDIAIRAAYGALPIPIGIRDITDGVLNAVLKVIDSGNITDAVIAIMRDRIPSGMPRDVFDTLVNVIGKHQPITKAAEDLAGHYVRTYTQGLASSLEHGLANVVGPAVSAIVNRLPDPSTTFASFAPHLKEITRVADGLVHGVQAVQHGAQALEHGASATLQQARAFVPALPAAAVPAMASMLPGGLGMVPRALPPAPARRVVPLHLAHAHA